MAPANRADDPTISNEERLWRRVPLEWIKIDPNTGNPIISSAAFRPSDEMSVNIASQTTPEEVLKNDPRHSLAEFNAGYAREIGCIVVRDPLPDDRSHALVCGKNPNGRLTKSQAKKIATQARLIVYRPPSE